MMISRCVLLVAGSLVCPQILAANTLHRSPPRAGDVPLLSSLAVDSGGNAWTKINTLGPAKKETESPGKGKSEGNGKTEGTADIETKNQGNAKNESTGEPKNQGNGKSESNGSSKEQGGTADSTVACTAPSCLDLTTRGASGSINSALFEQVDPQPTGTGKIRPFVRIQQQGQGDVEEGYNTSARPFEFDEKNPLNFTHDLPLSDVGMVELNGSLYREFWLDINESKNGENRLLSLDMLQLFGSSSPFGTNYPTGLGTLLYDLDTGSDHWILLDYALNHGSGSGDMRALIPNELFAGIEYVYLYSRFGEHYPENAGFEEWWSRSAFITEVPEPGALALFAAGLASGAIRLRNRRKPL